MKQSQDTDSLSEHRQVDEGESSKDIKGEQSDLLGAEIDPETLFEQWSKEDAWAREQLVNDDERFSVGRHPLILVIVTIVSGILAFHTFPALDAVIHEDDFEECGNVLERGLSKAKGQENQKRPHKEESTSHLVEGLWFRCSLHWTSLGSVRFRLHFLLAPLPLDLNNVQ